MHIVAIYKSTAELIFMESREWFRAVILLIALLQELSVYKLTCP